MEADNEPELVYACQTCGKADDKLTACTGCHVVVYCHVKCQREDWDVHRHECAELKKLPEDDAPPISDAESDTMDIDANGRGGRGGGRRAGGGGARAGPRRAVAPRGSGARTVAPRTRGYRTTPRQVYRNPARVFPRYPRTYRGGRYYYPGYYGRGTSGLWWSLFGLYPWYRPGYYSYFNSWYPRNGYYYYDNSAYLPSAGAPPPLPSFSPNTAPPEIDSQLQQLRAQYAAYSQRTGYVIIPDYETGAFRWAVPQ